MCRRRFPCSVLNPCGDPPFGKAPLVSPRGFGAERGDLLFAMCSRRFPCSVLNPCGDPLWKKAPLVSPRGFGAERGTRSEETRSPPRLARRFPCSALNPCGDPPWQSTACFPAWIRAGARNRERGDLLFAMFSPPLSLLRPESLRRSPLERRRLFPRVDSGRSEEQGAGRPVVCHVQPAAFLAPP